MRGHDAAAARQNAWAHLVSDVDNPDPTPVKIHSDANIFVSELKAACSLPLRVRASRQAYFLCLEGHVAVAGECLEESLSQHDAAEIVGDVELKLTAGANGAHLLVVEMKGQGEHSRFRSLERRYG